MQVLIGLKIESDLCSRCFGLSEDLGQGRLAKPSRLARPSRLAVSSRCLVSLSRLAVSSHFNIYKGSKNEQLMVRFMDPCKTAVSLSRRLVLLSRLAVSSGRLAV